MARTNAMGLRRDPQPPIPIVMPLRSCATASSRVVRLSLTLFALRGTGECVAVLVGHPGQVELEGKALLHAVTGVDPLHVDQVQRLLGRADDASVLGGDVAR